MLLPSQLIARNWQIEKHLASPKILSTLKGKYPEIDSAKTLQEFLRDLGKYSPFYELKAESKNGIWFISGMIADEVLEIDLDLITHSFRTPLESLVQSFIRQVDSPELVRKISESVRHLLKERGFPKAKIDVKKEKISRGLKYILKIDYGYPCLVDAVSFSFEIPKKVDLPFKEGDICDKEAFAKALESLEDNIRAQGYNQVRLDPPKYLYNSRSNTEKILLRGDLGKKIRYEIIDNERKFFLADLFSDNELKSIDPAIVGTDAMAADLAQRYRDKGYDDVVVSPPRIENVGNNESIYRFDVNAGPQYELTSIQFQGARVFNEKELLDTMGLSTLWQTSIPLNIKEIQKGIDAIRGKYRAAGYWDVLVRDPRITKNRTSGQAQMVILIDEGMQRRLTHIRMAGNKAISNPEILEMFQGKVGDPLNQGDLLALEKDLRNEYVGLGYLYATMNITLDYVSSVRAILTTINIKIEENVRVRIGDISVQGLVDTEQYVVIRELYFGTGDWYDPENLDKSRRALLTLGLFTSVQITPADRNALTERLPILDILIDVREGKPGKVSFGPGWRLSRGNRFNAEASYNNILGTGRQIYGRAYFSEETNQQAIDDKTLLGRTISIGYLEPYIFDLPLNATISGSNSARADEKWLLTDAGEVALVHKFRYFFQRGQVSLFYGQKVNREESSGEQKEGYLDILGGNVRIGQFGLRFNLDERNDITWPSAGYIFTSEFSLANFSFGGDLAYEHWEITNSHYFELTQDWVFAFGLAFARYQNIVRKGKATDVLPASEAIFIGGADTVRGYRERSLGPRVEFDEIDSNSRNRETIIGGSNSTLAKLEVRYQVIPDTFAVSHFVDSGTVFYSSKEVNRFDRDEAKNNAKKNTQNAGKNRKESEITDNYPYEFEELLGKPEYFWTKHYSSYGLALNYLTPLGSINLAYGLPWKRCAGSTSDDCKGYSRRGRSGKHWLFEGVFHINVGATF